MASGDRLIPTTYARHHQGTYAGDDETGADSHESQAVFGEENRGRIRFRPQFSVGFQGRCDVAEVGGAVAVSAADVDAVLGDVAVGAEGTVVVVEGAVEAVSYRAVFT